MPKRPRSHQLEDLSLNRFRQAVPTAWVVRERSRDYGVDLEVEIFTEDGEATGLFFYVQLRATDDPAGGRKLRFDVEQLEYFRLLDLPVAIVRYAAADDSLHLMWDFETPSAAGGSASQTLIFAPDQQWSDDTSTHIIQTLTTLRQLNRRSDGGALALKLVNTETDPDRVYAIQIAFERLQALGFVRPDPSSSSPTIECRSGKGTVVLRLDRIAEIVVDEADAASDLTAALAWSAVRLLWRLGLKPAANRLARRIVAAGLAVPVSSLALSGALALLPDTAAAVDLACAAGLHKGRDEGLLILTAAIHSLGLPDSDVDSRIALFKRALDDADEDQSADSEAGLHYSIANALRNAGRLATAVMHYKRALKLRPAYGGAAYFWAELGASLHLGCKHRAAVRAYEEAFRLDPRPLHALLTGDARLAAGEPGRAAELYDLAGLDGSVGSPGEAWLKAEFSRRLAGLHGARFARIRRDLDGLWAKAAADGDWAAILVTDPLDPLANFNAGKALADAGANEDAFWRFLAVALMQTADDEAWCNALICALNTDVVRMATVLHLALFHRGREVYDLLRGQLVDQGGHAILPELDAIVREVLADGKTVDPSLKIRLFDGEGFRHVLDVPAA